MSSLEFDRLQAGLRLLVRKGVIRASTAELVIQLLLESHLVPDPQAQPLR